MAGNLTDMNGVTRSYNDANQMTNDGTNTLTYDNNGNLTSDRANRLLSMGGHSYAYDGLGNRISQTVSSVVTEYLLDVQPSLVKVIAATSGGNTERYIHAQRGIHAMEDSSGNWIHPIQDPLGNVRMQLDDALDVDAMRNFAPYLTEFGLEGTFDLPFAVNGEPTDANGLSYHRARYLNPSLGVFPSFDPLEGIRSRPMSLNRYSWVEGNTPPIGWIQQVCSTGTHSLLKMETASIVLGRNWGLSRTSALRIILLLNAK